MSRLVSIWRIMALAALLNIASNAWAALEAVGGRSYQSIVERNPFGLRPPPTNAIVAPPTNQAGKSFIKLTGFTTIGDKRAYFLFTDEKTKTNRTESLRVDQEKDGLKVLEIDSIQHRVKVMREGIELVMTFATDGLTNATGGAVAAATGVPGVVPGAIPRPGSPPTTPVPMPTVTPGGILTPGISNPGTRTIPSRPVRTAQFDTTQSIYAGASAPGFGSTPPPLPIANNYTGPAPQRDQDAAQQTIMLEIQRQANPHLNLPPIPGLTP